MPISDKMIEPYLDHYADGGEYDEAMIQKVIDAAWTDFDGTNLSTWPEEDHSPSGVPWLAEDEEGNVDSVNFDRYLWIEEYAIVRYADPDVFKFKGKT